MSCVSICCNYSHYPDNLCPILNMKIGILFDLRIVTEKKNYGGREMEKGRAKLPSIYIQAAIAVMLIQFVHKIVREIPGSLRMEGPGGFVSIVFACLLAAGILLLLLRIKWGLLLGIIDGAWMLFQPIYVHVIRGLPDQNGIWWYPLFPWIHAVLIIYFCLCAWKRELYSIIKNAPDKRPLCR